jgi:hypothetical protein
MERGIKGGKFPMKEEYAHQVKSVTFSTELESTPCAERYLSGRLACNLTLRILRLPAKQTKISNRRTLNHRSEARDF